jgi:hypothetical protein
LKDVELIDMKDAQCAICLDLLIGSRQAICGHIFCSQCISEWLLRKEICPVCRQKIKKSPLRKVIRLKATIEALALCSVESIKKLKERKE